MTASKESGTTPDPDPNLGERLGGGYRVKGKGLGSLD